MLEIQNEPPPEQTMNFIGDSTNSQFHHNTFPNHATAPNPNPNFSIPRPPPPRKRPWGASQDHVDIHGHVKLYVTPVPRTLSEDDIRLVFEVYGTIVEVVLLWDKATGARQGSCLVKYSTINEAEMAIKGLSNQYTFPGEALPVVVRFADRKRERFAVDKIYVGNINKEASTQDIEEIFSPYGHIEDVYVVRNRGYGFVTFSNRETALAAIKGLNRTFTMRGCDQPLNVRFADPKKPKMGESRPLPNFCDSNTGGTVAHIAPHHSRLPHQQVNAHMPNWEPGATVVQQPFLPQHVNSQLASMPLRPIHPPNLPSQPFITKVQRQFHPADLPVQNIKQQLSSQLPTQTEHNNLVAVSTSPDLLTNPKDEEFPECDWSEHYCPDGNKYYYNCVTYESRWDKPEEYDKESLKQHKQDDHSTPCPQESQKQHKQDGHSIPCLQESQKQHKQDNHIIPCPQESQKQHKQDDHSIPCPQESQKQHKQDDHSIPCLQESQKQHKQDDHSITCPQESQKQHKQDDHNIPCPQESQKQHKQDDHSIPCPQEPQKRHNQDDHSIPCSQLSLSSSQEVSQRQQETNNDHMQSETSPVVEQV
ncbi:flowering time control protein FCA isoform X2 [Vicia villosa]|uniref:flowering time control protein FCA isoform X2 n=1 Tax=Vicia villosa TaxID=3911 RepID=UPI00273BDC67|nr:flowering time control protein FCA isoform X2 [Vicia villosa]